jgi:hypothetical protein
MVLLVHPLLCQILPQRNSIRTLLRSLSRFIPSDSTSTDLFSREFYLTSSYSLIVAQCCDKCLRILQCILQVNKQAVLEATTTRAAVSVEEQPEAEPEPDLPVTMVAAIVRILAGAERNLNWFPVLLRASDIFQVLPSLPLLFILISPPSLSLRSCWWLNQPMLLSVSQP